jgi:hypothetical protein
MKWTKGMIYILAMVGLGCSPKLSAAHATNFLDALQNEVTNRLASADTNVSRPELRALSNAARTLDRDTKTLSGDLGVLAAAATQLNTQFPEDETLADLETDAIADYSAVAHARLDGIFLWIGTNEISGRLSNQVVKADAALERADANTNGVPAQARALAQALNKILPVEKKVRSMFTAPPAPPVIPPPVAPPTNPPPIIPPGTPGLAPDSIGTRFVTCYENAIVNEQSVFYFSTAQSGAQIYNVHHPEELGLWTYMRTGTNTGVITVDPDYPDNAPQRPVNLTFTNTVSGTFTATTFFGEALQGTFRVD